MKVTAIIPDDLVKDVRRYAKKTTLTDCLVVVMQEFVALRKIKELTKKLQKQPLQFQKGFTAERVRSVNRRKRG
jgi:hypothetical protein